MTERGKVKNIQLPPLKKANSHIKWLLNYILNGVLFHKIDILCRSPWICDTYAVLRKPAWFDLKLYKVYFSRAATYSNQIADLLFILVPSLAVWGLGTFTLTSLSSKIHKRRQIEVVDVSSDWLTRRGDKQIVCFLLRVVCTFETCSSQADVFSDTLQFFFNEIH